MSLEGKESSRLFEEVFDENINNTVLLVDFDKGTIGLLAQAADGSMIVNHEEKLLPFVAHFANTRLVASDIERVIAFFEKDVFLKRMSEKSNFHRDTIKEYNGIDCWNEVEIIAFPAPWRKEGEAKFVLVHTVVKHNVSIVSEVTNVMSTYNYKANNPLTGLPMGYSFIKKAKDKILAYDVTHCLISMKVYNFLELKKNYGNTVADKLVNAVGTFLRNMDTVYGTVSAYNGGDVFFVLIPYDDRVIDYVVHGVNNLIKDFEEAKGYRASFGGIIVESNKTVSVGDIIQKAQNMLDFDSETVKWYKKSEETIAKDNHEVGISEDLYKMLKSNKRKKIRIDQAIDKMVARFLTAGDFTDEEINGFLATIRDAYDVDSVYISVTLPDKRGLQVIYEAVKDAQYVQLGYIVPINHEKVEGIINNHDKSDIVTFDITIEDGTTMPNILQRMFFRDDFFDGAVGMLTYYKREWTEEECEAVMRISSMLRYIVEKKHLSMTDQYIARSKTVDSLTNLLNRNAFEVRMEEEEDLGRGVAVIYADVDGLKECNDKFGHEEGDKLLCRAANALMSYFPYQNIYRFGGDEFVIVQRDISKEETNERMVDFFAYLSTQEDLNISVGVVWRDKDINIKEMLREADERMYVAKRRYYETGRHEED